MKDLHVICAWNCAIAGTFCLEHICPLFLPHAFLSLSSRTVASLCVGMWGWVLTLHLLHHLLLTPLPEPFLLAAAVGLGGLPCWYWSGLSPPPLVPLPSPWRRQTVCGKLSLPINYHTGPVTGTVCNCACPPPHLPHTHEQIAPAKKSKPILGSSKS